MALKQSRRFEHGVAATGTVVELTKRFFRPGSAGVYCPIVEFTTAEGQAVRFESASGTMPASHQVGQSIAVRYAPADPQQAEVDSTFARWLVPGIAIGIGAVFLILGAFFLLIGFLLLGAQK
jgi:hypothetical protein